LERSTGLAELEGSAGEERACAAAAGWKAGHVAARAGKSKVTGVRRPADIAAGAGEAGEGGTGYFRFEPILFILTGHRVSLILRPYKAKELRAGAGKATENAALGTAAARHITARTREIEGAGVGRPADIALAAGEAGESCTGNIGFYTVSKFGGDLVHAFFS
jgi:hypothetical protein